MFKANINYFFSRYSGQHLAIARTHHLPWPETVYCSDDLDLTEFFHSLLCGIVEYNGNIRFRDFAALHAFATSLENFCILEFSRAYALADFQLLNIEHFIVQLTNSAVFLRDNYECFI